MSRQEWERIKVEDFDRLEADLAQAHARADALVVENAELREAIASTHRVLMPVDLRDARPSLNARLHEALRILEAAHALAADPAQRGADLIAAADAMAEQIEELNGEYLGCELAAQAYRRLRGGRGPEGGDE